MTTGQKINECRKKSGMTQEELADRLGVTRQAVSKWEQDVTFPETEKVLEMCKLFSVSADELLFGRENVHKEEPLSEVLAQDIIVQPIAGEKTESDEAPEKLARPKSVEEKWNLFSIFAFCLEVIAAACMVQVIITIVSVIILDAEEIGNAPLVPAFILMMIGLFLAITGLATGKRIGRKGRGFAISAIWIFVFLFIIVLIGAALGGALVGGFMWLIVWLSQFGWGVG